MAVEELPEDLPPFIAPEDLAALLEAQAGQIVEEADRRARHLRELAGKVREQGISQGWKHLRPDVDLEGAIRDFFAQDGVETASERVLTEALGIKLSKLRPVLQALERGGKAGHVTVNRERIWAWVAPDVNMATPNEARTQSPSPTWAPEVQRLAVVGEPVRVRKSTRRQRSTEGAGGIKGVRQKERRYQEQKAAREKRAEEQRAKSKK